MFTELYVGLRLYSDARARRNVVLRCREGAYAYRTSPLRAWRHDGLHYGASAWQEMLFRADGYHILLCVRFPRFVACSRLSALDAMPDQHLSLLPDFLDT